MQKLALAAALFLALAGVAFADSYRVTFPFVAAATKLRCKPNLPRKPGAWLWRSSLALS